MKVTLINENTWMLKDAIIQRGIHLAHTPEGDIRNCKHHEDIAPCKDSTMVRLGHTASSSGHDKFLRMLNATFLISAPRYWWSEFDTYKIGTVALSASTMHTLKYEPLTQESFSFPINDEYLKYLNEIRINADLTTLKAVLPEGFIQTRMVQISGATLKNMYNQRHSHPLFEWRIFCIDYIKKLKMAELFI